MNSRYITFPLVADAQALIQRAFEFMQTKFIGWVPAEGNLDTAIIESVAGEGADVAALTTQVPKTIFGYIGQTMFDVPVLSATTALFHSTWNLSDNLGHTIVAGTQIGIRNTTGDLIPFMVLTDVIVPAGTVATATGAVTCVAINTGSDANGLGVIGGVVELIDPLAWVDNIVQTDIPDGGTDGETADAYLDRLSMKLKTIAPRPIIPRDFEIMARDITAILQAPDRSLRRKYHPHLVVDAQIRSTAINISLDHSIDRDRGARWDGPQAIEQLDRLSKVGHLNGDRAPIESHRCTGFIGDGAL